MRTKEKIIELIREGKLVLDIDGFKGTQTATDVFNEIRKFTWVANYRYYGVDADGIFVALFAYELNNREIVTLQEYLDSPSEKDSQGSREYDEKLLMEFISHPMFGFVRKGTIERFLDRKYGLDLLKEKEQLEQRLSEINKQLK